MNKTNKRGFTIVELLVAMGVFQVVLLLTIVAYMQISRFYQKSINSARLQQISSNVVDEISRSIQNTGGLVSGSNLIGGIDIDNPNANQDLTNSKNITIINNKLIGANRFTVLCVDSTRYFYRLSTVANPAIEPGDTLPNGTPAQPGDHVFLSEIMASPSACATDPGPNLRVILGQNMSLIRFGVAQNPNATSTYNVWIMSAYTSDIDDLDVSAISPALPNTAQPTINSYLACKGGSGRQYCAVTNISTTVVRRIGL